LKHRAPPNFETLYREQKDRIYRFCYRLCGNAADAEDLAQEVFLLAYQSLHQFKGRSSVTTWLYRIALNRWQRIRVKRPPDEPFHEETRIAGAACDPERIGIGRITLDAAMARLPDVLREAFLLVKVEGLKCREAAELLNIPLGTLLSRVHDATLRLRAALTEEETERERTPQPPVKESKR
jgi:RNA polymerase sigma-70 factor (ECF subfamily)